MNAIVKQDTAIKAFELEEGKLVEVLRNSLYPGAKDESISLVISYCRASNLDPMQKPVHIVPMKVKTGTKEKSDGTTYDTYEYRDTIMPGIGLYRIQAARTGKYAGMDEPVFGPLKKLEYRRKIVNWVDAPGGKRKPVETYEDGTLEYPEWCTVTVYRMVDGVRCPFPATERWLENYATAGSSRAPNSMWERRVFAQLNKVAEAQALRKAFPEIPQGPTAEEMEGKSFYDVDPDTGEILEREAGADAPRSVKMPQRKQQPAAEALGASEEPVTLEQRVDKGNVTDVEFRKTERPQPEPAQPPAGDEVISSSMAAYVRKNSRVRPELLTKVGCTSIEAMTPAQFAEFKSLVVRGG